MITHLLPMTPPPVNTRAHWDAMHILSHGPLSPEQLAEDLGRDCVRSLIGTLVANGFVRRLTGGVGLTLSGFEHLAKNPDAERLAPETLRVHLTKSWANITPDGLAKHFNLDTDTVRSRLAELGALEMA